jgi:outer membrane scaffolding protein for murein synthesis (MipA/OmpV family)
MKKLKLLHGALAGSAVMLSTAGALAQEMIPVDLPEERNMIGAGAFAVPDFYGADSYRAKGTGFLHANLGNGLWLQFIGPELRVNLVPSLVGQNYPQFNQLRAGFTWRSRPSRENDRGDAVVRQMQRIPNASELGVFASYSLPLDANPLHKIVLSGDATWSTNTVYTGAVGNIRATYFHPFPQEWIGRPLLGSAGFSLFFTSDHFNERYFGINGADLALFPQLGGVPYRPEGGLTSIRIPFSLTSEIAPKWSLTVAGRYERLLEDAADSPIVRQRGNENQWVVGAALNYFF